MGSRKDKALQEKKIQKTLVLDKKMMEKKMERAMNKGKAKGIKVASQIGMKMTQVNYKQWEGKSALISFATQRRFLKKLDQKFNLKDIAFYARLAMIITLATLFVSFASRFIQTMKTNKTIQNGWDVINVRDGIISNVRENIGTKILKSTRIKILSMNAYLAQKRIETEQLLNKSRMIKPEENQ